MKVGVLKETYPGERRVAMAPANIPHLQKLGLEVLVESGAGVEAGYADNAYFKRGAHVVASRAEVLTADILLAVRALGANPQAGAALIQHLRPGQYLIATCDPLGHPGAVQEAAAKGAVVLSLELIPRITRAQSMDVLSSMASLAGYRAVLLAALELPKMFPMMMTAAGTLAAARVFVLGAGVAGLQAIATARRLGGVVQGYDVRPACREQVESLGAKFVELDLKSADAEDKGGYAKAMGEEFYEMQRAALAKIASDCDVVITTAAIPGKPSPLLITAAAVAGMAPGSVIVDLAAERGGNCELTKADQRVVEYGVTILGPTNLVSDVAQHASQMFANNVTKYLGNLIQDGQVNLNLEDPIVHDTLLTRDGEVVNPRLREMLGLPALTAASPETE